jgi:hypothetical protein
MTAHNRRIPNLSPRTVVAALTTALIAITLHAQAPATPPASSPAVPEWAQPGSATHKQVAPPLDFHRPPTTINTPIGIFDGQSDVGSAVAPGSAIYDSANKSYIINSAGYNIWYNRDEFRFLWKKLSGDASLATDVSFPVPKGFGDRKAVLVIRQSLDDDSKEILAGLHGTGMLQFAQRTGKGQSISDMEYSFKNKGVAIAPKRLGIEKHGDAISLFVSIDGEPLHQFGPPVTLPFDGPFYVGIGFCSHLPDKVDSAAFSNVVLENAAGKIH